MNGGGINGVSERKVEKDRERESNSLQWPRVELYSALEEVNYTILRKCGKIWKFLSKLYLDRVFLSL